MDERLRESISALMDDEANELELQRVLSNVDDDLATVWNRYHQVRQVVRECDRDVMNIDIRASLSLELDESVAVAEFSPENDAAVAAALPSGATKRFGLGRSFAIAASIAVAVVVGVQYQSVGTNELPLLAETDTESKSTIDTLPVASAKEPKIYVEFDERHARRFNEYLLRHAEHSAFGSSQGIMPLARVASVNSVGI